MKCASSDSYPCEGGLVVPLPTADLPTTTTVRARTTIKGACMLQRTGPSRERRVARGVGREGDVRGGWNRERVREEVGVEGSGSARPRAEMGPGSSARARVRERGEVSYGGVVQVDEGSCEDSVEVELGWGPEGVLGAWGKTEDCGGMA